VTPPADLEVPLDNPSRNALVLKESLKVLKEIIRIKRAKVEDLKCMGLDRDLIVECLKLLSLYKLISKDRNGNYKPAEALLYGVGSG